MPKAPKEDEIGEALQPFQPPKTDALDTEAMTTAVIRKLLDEHATVELDELPGLEDEDGTARARQTYVLSYLRILDFLRSASDSFNERKAQAQMALSFIRHAEAHSLDILQLGRQRGDDKLVAKVAKLQQALESQAQYAIEQEKRQWRKHERPDPPGQGEIAGAGEKTESGEIPGANDSYVN